MQIIISAICTNGSLREAIGNDAPSKFRLRLDKMQTPGRHPGWLLKLHSAEEQRGAINVVWDAQAHILTARRDQADEPPSPIVGDLSPTCSPAPPPNQGHTTAVGVVPA